MMRWIMVGLSVLGFALAFVTRSPLVLGLCLLLGFAGMFGAVLAFAAERIAATSRPESVMLSRDDLVAMRERAGSRPKQAAQPPAALSPVPGDTDPSNGET
ncbi:MAG: hypothetical protein WBV61_09400 [Rhodanobacteraceae bacterium]